IMAPADERECRQMLFTGVTLKAPAAVRYPRGGGPGVDPGRELETLPLGKAQVRRRGRGLALLAFGSMVPTAEAVGEVLDATVVNMRFVEPLDEAQILELAANHTALVTLEESAIAGGAGSGVLEVVQAHGVTIPVLQLGIPDRFIEHGSYEDN